MSTFHYAVPSIFFFFLCFQWIYFQPQTDKLFNNFPIELALHFNHYFFVFIIVELTFFPLQRKIEQLLIGIEVLNLIRARISISKLQCRIWILLLDITVVEIVHQCLGKIQGDKSQIDWAVQRLLDFSSFRSHMENLVFMENFELLGEGLSCEFFQIFFWCH